MWATFPAAPGITAQPRVGRADTRDVEAARSLHRRCSRRTLELRYPGHATDADTLLPHLLSESFGHTLLVRASSTTIGLGHLLWDGDEAEVALLVEDAWQRRGIGTALLRRLLTQADEAGLVHVYAITRPSNTGMVATLRTLGTPSEQHIQSGDLVTTLRTSR